MDSLTDEQLVTLVNQGNVSAFNSLARRWEAPLYRFIRRTLGNADDSRDVCQEALVKAYLNIRNLRDGARFKSWLHYIALNLCRDRFRSARGRAVVQTFEEGFPEESAPAARKFHPVAPDRSAERSSTMNVLEEILAELPEEQRLAIVLREYQGFTSEEIGEMTGVAAATVRTRIFYGLKSVRKRLRERGIEGSWET